MPSILISWPAGADKSRLARELLAAAPLGVVADFQSIYVALTLLERGRDGRYPLCDERLLPTVEYVRRALITGAVARDLDVIATNSDGDPVRRAALLASLGPGAVERIIDPGLEVVTSRLADPVTGDLGAECDRAIQRWYQRRNPL